MSTTTQLITEIRGILLAHATPKERSSYSYEKLIPNLMLNDTMKQLGRYQPGNHLIEINTSFIFQHPWYAVVDVLLHELAHHLAFYYHPNLDEPPHGETFKYYANMLGANPHASGNYPPLDETIYSREDANTTLSPMEARIRKLLALSSSPNEHEAQQALIKARELMAKHDIDEERLDNESDPYVTVYVTPEFVGYRCQKTYLTREELSLNSLLNNYYEVKVLSLYSSTLNDCKEWEKTEMVGISGKRSKVKIAIYVRGFIAAYVKRHFQNYDTMSPRCRDWTLGLLEGFSSVLDMQNETPEMHALVQSNATLQQFIHRRFPHIVTTRRKAVSISREDWDNGKKAGEKLDIKTAVENNGSNTLLLS